MDITKEVIQTTRRRPIDGSEIEKRITISNFPQKYQDKLKKHVIQKGEFYNQLNALCKKHNVAKFLVEHTYQYYVRGGWGSVASQHIIFNFLPDKVVIDITESDRQNDRENYPAFWSDVEKMLDNDLTRFVNFVREKDHVKDLINGEMSGILRDSGKAKGIVEPGSAFEKVLDSGILPSEVGKFLTKRPTEGSVKPAIRIIKKVMGKGRSKTRRINKKSLAAKNGFNKR